MLCGGRFASIDQDKGTVAVATPMDKELAELSAKLNTTYVAYGSEGKEQAGQPGRPGRQRRQDAPAPRPPRALPRPTACIATTTGTWSIA